MMTWIICYTIFTVTFNIAMTVFMMGVISFNIFSLSRRVFVEFAKKQAFRSGDGLALLYSASVVLQVKLGEFPHTKTYKYIHTYIKVDINYIIF